MRPLSMAHISGEMLCVPTFGCGQMNGVNSTGAAAKVTFVDRLGKKVRPGTFGKMEVGNWSTQKVPLSKNTKFPVAPLVLTPFVPFRDLDLEHPLRALAPGGGHHGLFQLLLRVRVDRLVRNISIIIILIIIIILLLVLLDVLLLLSVSILSIRIISVVLLLVIRLYVMRVCIYIYIYMYICTYAFMTMVEPSVIVRTSICAMSPSDHWKASGDLYIYIYIYISYIMFGIMLKFMYGIRMCIYMYIYTHIYILLEGLQGCTISTYTYVYVLVLLSEQCLNEYMS